VLLLDVPAKVSGGPSGANPLSLVGDLHCGSTLPETWPHRNIDDAEQARCTEPPDLIYGKFRGRDSRYKKDARRIFMPFCGIRGTSSLSSYKVQDVSLVIQNIQSICCHTSQRKIGGQSVTKALKLHTPVQYILRIAGLTSVVSLRLHCINFGWHSAALIN